MSLQIDSRFKRQALAISVCLAWIAPACAMQELDDAGLAASSGEGIAFAVNDFSMQLNGADNTPDIGYLRLIPVGPQSKTIDDHNKAVAAGCGSTTPSTGCTSAQIADAQKYNVKIGKADAYVYGLAISKNDNAGNTRFSGQTVNIGSYSNPWMINAATVNVPDYNSATANRALSYLNIEAPLFTALGTVSGADPNAYDLKFGAWLDAFVRDPALAEGSTGQFQLNGATRNASATDTTQIPRENRLRAQVVLNGFSINGTNVKIFQTPQGAESAAGLGPDYASYNRTLGLAALVRINSGDASGLKLVQQSDNTASSSTYDTGSATAWNTIHGGWNSTLSPATTAGDCNNGGASGTAYTNSGSYGCQYMVQGHTRTDTKTRTVTWSLPGAENHVLRVSSKEGSDNSTTLLKTPALDGGTAPAFADNSGLYLYNPNINLVLGNLWQPLIIGVAADNRNLVAEVTRIPNNPAIYKQIYTDYTGADASYKGGTCNIYWCGDSNKNATHSSITIGTTNYDRTNNLLTAYSGADAVGVSFGSLASASSTVSTSASLSEIRYQQRGISDTKWTQAYSCTAYIFCGSDKTGDLYQWVYNTSPTTTTNWNAISAPPNASCSPNIIGSCSATSGTTPMYGTAANRAWTPTNTPGTWLTASNTAVDSLIGSRTGQSGGTGYVIPAANQAPTPTVTSALNNLGSAAIDGLLIQHLKLTTKGL